MSEDLGAEVVELAQELVDRIVDAEAVTAFDDEGNGPLLSICDDPGFRSGPGPIRRLAERLRDALIARDRAKVMRAL